MFLGILFIKVLTSGSLDFKFSYYAGAKVCIYCVTSSENKMLFKIGKVPASRKLHFNWKRRKQTQAITLEIDICYKINKHYLRSHEFLYKEDN